MMPTVERGDSDEESVYQLKVTLQGIRPPVWRRIQVDAHTTLAELHDVLQAVMGWTGSSLHQFEVGAVLYGPVSAEARLDVRDEREVILAEVAEQGSRFVYEYDIGDCWRHDIVVERMAPRRDTERYPVCITGRRACPPEDSGGPNAYSKLLKALREPKHPDRERLVECSDRILGADIFDLQEVNRRLGMVRRKLRRRGSRGRAAVRTRRPVVGPPELAAELVTAPPASERELLSRLSAVDVETARRCLLILVATRADDEMVRTMARDGFHHFGIGGMEETLAEMAADPTLAPTSRGLAFEIVTMVDRSRAERLLARVDPAERELLLREQFGGLLLSLAQAPEHAQLVTEALAGQTAAGHPSFLEFVEECRLHVGMPACIVYADALRSSSVAAVRSRLLEILVGAGGSQTSFLLQQVRDEADDPVWRRELQRAIMRVHTAELSPAGRRRSREGQAFLTPCDGTGSSVVVAVLETGGAGATFVSVCMRPDEIRSGTVMARASAAEVESVLRDLVASSGGRFVALSLDEAAGSIAAVARRVRAAGRPLPHDVRVAVALLEDAWSGCPPPDISVDAAPSVTLREVERLLDRPEYMGSWLFGRDELDGVEPPAAPGAVASWRRRAAQRLDERPTRERLSRLARYMARWHELDGDLRAAAVCLALAREVERSFPTSRLVHAMLARSARAAAGEPEPGDWLSGVLQPASDAPTAPATHGSRSRRRRSRARTNGGARRGGASG